MRVTYTFRVATERSEGGSARLDGRLMMDSPAEPPVAPPLGGFGGKPRREAHGAGLLPNKSESREWGRTADKSECPIIGLRQPLNR